MSFPVNPFGAIQPKLDEKEESPEKDLRPWLTVEVGESWFVEDYSNRNPYLAASVHGRRFGKRFTSRREGYGMRVTRVE